VEQIEHLADLAGAFEAGEVLGAEGEILAEREMGEEGGALEDIAAVAAARGEIGAGGGIEEKNVVDEDAAFAWGGETGDGIEGEGLASAAGTEEDSDAGTGGEVEVEGEGMGVLAFWEGHADAGVDHIRRPFRGRRGRGGWRAKG
jgi:hypothetical protein